MSLVLLGTSFSLVKVFPYNVTLTRMKQYQNIYGNKFEPGPMLVKMAEKDEKF